MLATFRVSWHQHPQDDHIVVYLKTGDQFEPVGRVHLQTSLLVERDVAEGDVLHFALAAERGDKRTALTAPVSVTVPFLDPIQPSGLSVDIV